MRFKIILEYDGRPFRGWQKQENRIASVQQTVEEAITAFCGEQLTLVAAGRTDAGVHALGQVCHVDFSKPTTAYTVRRALNYHLRDKAVKVLVAEEVSEDFNARFSAITRTYQYRVLNRIAPPVIDVGRVWHVHYNLNLDAMREAAKYLLGYHDFTTFRDSECQAKHALRTLDVLDVTTEGNYVLFDVAAKSFLHHQVRNMVGTLVLVGRGKWTPQRVKDALEAKDRRAGGTRAPAEGLYFTSVLYEKYPKNFQA